MFCSLQQYVIDFQGEVRKNNREFGLRIIIIVIFFKVSMVNSSRIINANMIGNTRLCIINRVFLNVKIYRKCAILKKFVQLRRENCNSKFSVY